MFEADNKENPIVKNILDNLSSAMDTLKNEIANIDEIYRKKLEEAKASLVACLEETTKQYEYWSGLDAGNMPAAAPKKRRTRKTAVETILERDEEEKKEEVVEDLPFVEEEKVVDEEVVGEVETPVAESTEFTESTENPDDLPWEESSEEKKEEDDNDGWGDFPAEWKD
jgi:hypothetical protein